MSITDELRKYADTLSERARCGATIPSPLNPHSGAPIGPTRETEELYAIADRIDDEHEKLMQEQPFTIDMVPMTNENMAEHGWVRGPLDADGVMWHEGDMSDSVWGEIELIMRDCDGHWYIKGHDTSAPWVRADSKRHHHEPTVEDVLREFVTEFNRDDTELCDEEIIERFTAKLQLKEQE